MQKTCMLLSELIKEHRRLIRILKSRKGITPELRRQEAELRDYINKRKIRHDKDMFGSLPRWRHRHL